MDDKYYRDCRDCFHNTYVDSINVIGWVDCSHPITVEKTPRPQKGDPAWVNFMTADKTVEEMFSLMQDKKCPAWESNE